MCTEGSPLYSVTHWKPKWDILLSRHMKGKYQRHKRIPLQSMRMFSVCCRIKNTASCNRESFQYTQSEESLVL